MTTYLINKNLSSCSSAIIRGSNTPFSSQLNDGPVLHIRLSDFELQVERLLNSSLRTRAIAVISSHHQNGTLVSVSREALEEGLYPGLRVTIARKMSHSVILLPYNATLYNKVHNYIYQTLTHYAPVVEPTVYGQYFADMSGMNRIYRNSVQAGYLIARDIHGKVNLASQIGISVNKLVSQITTAVVPEMIHRVEPGGEAHFLAPLTPEVLPIATEPMVNKLIRFLFLNEVKHIQEITAVPSDGAILFGKFHSQLYAESHGIDNSKVQPPQQRDCLVEQTVLTADTNDEEILQATVTNLAERLAYQLRRRQQVARLLTLEVHYTDGFKNVRRGSVTYHDDKTVIGEALRLFNLANYRRNRVRAIIIEARNFRPCVGQLHLFRAPRDERVSAALDHIRQEYGWESIQTGNSLLIPNTQDRAARVLLKNSAPLLPCSPAFKPVSSSLSAVSYC